MLPIRKLVVVGVGLIGGSFALALRRGGNVGQVVGVGRTRSNLDAALAANIVDRALTLDEPWTRETRDADLVFIAAPVAQCGSLFSALAGSLGATTLVTDAGSTKQDIVAAARAHLGDAIARFVPAHPIAGTENAGAGAAFASLYERRSTIVTRLPETDPRALATVRAAWEACGARVVEMDARRHDHVFAAVSHLPHLLSAAYVAELAVRHEAGQLFAHAGTGFGDFTRIAAASPEMWRDITLANREELLTELAAYRAALDVITAAMEQGDGTALTALFQSASDARRAWASARGDG